MKKSKKSERFKGNIEKQLNFDLWINIIFLSIVSFACLLCCYFGWVCPRLWSGLVATFILLVIVSEVSCFFNKKRREKRMKQFIEIQSMTK